MNSVLVKLRALCASATEGCRRLVDTAGLTAEGVGVRLRMTQTLIAAPAVAVSATALTLSQVDGPATLAVANFLIFGACWLAGLFVASYGKEKLIGALSLAGAAVLAGGLIALGGGLASPMAVLALALVFEPWWVWRSERAILVGVIAAVGAVVASTLVPVAGAGGASATLWLPVMIYGMTIAARLMKSESSESNGATSFELAEALDAAVLRLTVTGEVSDVTEKTRDLMRLPPELLLQQGLFDRVHVADRVAYMCALSDLRNGAKNRQLDMRVRLPAENSESLAGVYEWFSAEFVRLPSDETGVIAIFREAQDVSELNARVELSEERAAQAELSKASFLAAVSHELRTPLNAIIGFSDMLTHELYGRFADPRQKEHVALISEAGNHLLGVVNAILDVSKIELGAYSIIREPFNLGATVSTSLSMISVQAERKDIAIDVQIDPAIGEIDADVRAIRQILINLLSNAVKFTPEGGTVAIGASDDGSAVRIWVKDTGVGIAPQDIARLGQAFVQAGDDYARRGDGTGLGLALVKGLAQLHGGSLTIESEVGAGTTAIVSIPKTHQAGEPGQAEVQILRNGLDHGAFRKTA
ncbi:HAMP domain-containing sensor histidine kinase [Mesorhizobium sp. GR13]|uniref:sensor histidine kinase n=1 Tax=Mesorhizobium sp. GR13 TaxID=2562308 RepID=UPI0011C03525|nr:HAMP domain-containing sensor histidine kinase [Mesorhizobium sp. GR13]